MASTPTVEWVARGSRVLIVAEGEVLAVVGALASAAGAVVLAVGDGVVLAEALSGPAPDRIVVALELGWAPPSALLSALRKRFPSAPIVALGDVAAAGVLGLAVDHTVRVIVPATVAGLARLVVANAEVGGRADPSPGATPPAAPPAAPDAAATSRFAAEVAHDLREPLRASRLWLERLEARLAEGDVAGAQSVAAKLYDAAARLDDLVEGALADVRGTTPEEPASSHADQVLSEVIEQLEALVAETGGRVDHDPLPEVALHAHQLRQILQNLVANALRYGGRPPEVFVSAAESEGRWVLSVRDNGAGIPVEQREAIFRPLTRLGGANLPTGHGLGLAICRKVVERAGGRIWVETAPSGGSVFFVAIPTLAVEAGPVRLAGRRGDG